MRKQISTTWPQITTMREQFSLHIMYLFFTPKNKTKNKYILHKENVGSNLLDEGFPALKHILDSPD